MVIYLDEFLGAIFLATLIPFPLQVTRSHSFAFQLPHLSIMREVGAGTEVAEQSLDADSVIPTFDIRGAWVYIFRSESLHQMAEFIVG